MKMSVSWNYTKENFSVEVFSVFYWWCFRAVVKKLLTLTLFWGRNKLKRPPNLNNVEYI